jgi:hypothetical protein
VAAQQADGVEPSMKAGDGLIEHPEKPLLVLAIKEDG